MSANANNECGEKANGSNSNNRRERRTKVPARPKNATPNYLTLLKSCVVGKDLSKMALPVEFNEPLSMLQRLTEELEYAHLLLDRAAEESDLHRRTALVAVFAISGYSTLGQRPTKPFNPLLGETFECDRSQDRGWRSLAEQFSHHPPGSLLHAQGSKWTLEQQYLFETKLKGTNICVSPLGQTTIKFADGQLFTYGKLPTSTSIDAFMNGGTAAKNGASNNNHSSTNNSSENAAVDCFGELCISSSGRGSEGIKCTLQFHGAQRSRKGSKSALTQPHELSKNYVKGSILDVDGIEKYRVEAVRDKWARIVEEDMTNPKPMTTTKSTQIWRANELPEDAHQMHNFTGFAIELNEDDPTVAPTDSRRRIDQRLCELGEFTAANRFKKNLEEAQRTRLKDKEGTRQPLWFCPKENEKLFTFTGEYWKAKESRSWDKCPELFAI